MTLYSPQQAQNLINSATAAYDALLLAGMIQQIDEMVKAYTVSLPGPVAEILASSVTLASVIDRNYEKEKADANRSLTRAA